MTSERALQLCFLGFGGALVSWIIRDSIDSFIYDHLQANQSLRSANSDGWLTVALLIAGFVGAYCIARSRLNSN